MGVVAFLRDKQKLEQILYKEEDLVMGNLVETGNGGMKNDDGGGKKKRNDVPVVRIFQRNIARWSSDLTHSTERILEEVEKEQQMRDAVVRELSEEEEGKHVEERKSEKKEEEGSESEWYTPQLYTTQFRVHI